MGVEQLIDIYYGPLSELTHPNWAALTLGIDVGMPPKFTYPVVFSDHVLHDVAGSSAYILAAGGRAFDDVLVALRETTLDLQPGDPDWGSSQKAGG